MGVAFHVGRKGIGAHFNFSVIWKTASARELSVGNVKLERESKVEMACHWHLVSGIIPELSNIVEREIFARQRFAIDP